MKRSKEKVVFLDREDIPYRSSSEEDDEIVDSYYRRSDDAVIWVVRTKEGAYYQIICD